MRIYLAGPMRGYPDDNFPAFYEAEERLRRAGHQVFNPADNDTRRTLLGMPNGLREVFADDLGWICTHAEAVAFLPGWRDSKGARAEQATALAIGIDTGDVEDFL